MNRVLASGCRAAVAMAFGCAPLWAQTAPDTDVWTHGTTISVSGGLASGSSETGGLAGGAVGWEITPRFGVEGTGAWLDRRNDSHAFAAALAFQAALMPSRPLAPFVEGGFGLYRATFDLSRRNMPYDVARSMMPAFYRDRIDLNGPVTPMMNTFTDPMFVAGAGLNVFASRHFAVKPQVEAFVVIRDGANHVVTAVTVHAVYHFEDHPVTGSRRR